jgi:glucose-1-phosphate cytidylyltransferase
LTQRSRPDGRHNLETEILTALAYWINGGFMLFERSVLDLMVGKDVNLETEILTALAQQQQLMIYRHDGFWQSMNTMKDTLLLEKIWQENPPWKVW